ncbi:ProQ/FinO family protein [Mesorhizobium sp. M1B.F.Ca.ET.045.04.1.1]|uniref:ProQ/FinO family protein n=1 Tax=Mesorhizobium sp. M1B.F.Ca.ET.045.04.1.1 TaxID=2493673 RepID=UPI0016735BEF|nr:ProQ/FinO family protein [Mesorhizobium sp. M1B.F.Ca.ET.045.04.1.1]
MSKPFYTYREHINPARERLAKLFPSAFSRKGEPAKRPLKIGIDKDVLAAVKDIPRRVIKLAISDYCTGPKYAKAMVEGAVRIDLDGNPAGVVSAHSEAYARAREATRLERVNNRHVSRQIVGEEARP